MIQTKHIRKVWDEEILLNLEVLIIDEISMVRADVLDAIDLYKRGIETRFLDSTTYDLLHDGEAFPPKAIIGLAASRLNGGRHLNPEDFSGGVDSKCFRVLEALGFRIVQKRPKSNQAKVVIKKIAEALVLAENEETVSEEHDWSDVTGVRYNYPNSYVNRIKSGLPFVYYRGVRRKGGKRGQAEYFGSGVIGDIWKDPTQKVDIAKKDRQWFCTVENFERFKTPVPHKIGGQLFERIENSMGWRTGVREISLETYEKILSYTNVVVAGSQQFKEVSTEDSAPAVLDLEDAFLKRPKVNKGKHGEGAKPRYSKRSKEIGDWCEELVVMDLKARLTPLEADSIRWLAREGETPGWDIEYISSNGSKKRVEVKGTTAARFSSLEITSNEWEAAKKHRGDYQIALVVNAMNGKEALRYLEDPFEYFNQPSYCVEPSRYRISQFDE